MSKENDTPPMGPAEAMNTIAVLVSIWLRASKERKEHVDGLSVLTHGILDACFTQMNEGADGRERSFAVAGQLILAGCAILYGYCHGFNRSESEYRDLVQSITNDAMRYTIEKPPFTTEDARSACS